MDKKIEFFVLSLLVLLTSSCESKKSMSREELISEYKAAAECLEQGHPIVKCQQRSANACDYENSH